MSAPDEVARASHPRSSRSNAESLYRVSRALARFESVEQTVPEVIALMRAPFDLRTTFVIVETGGRAQSLGWKTDVDEAGPSPPPRMRNARTRARAALAYFNGTANVTVARGSEHVHFVSLPLAVSGSPAFGVVQLEASRPLDESELGYICEVVGELALALDRHARGEVARARLREQSLEAERALAAVQARRVDAERRAEAAERAERAARLLAELGVTLASATTREAIVTDGAKSVVPLLADVCWVDADDVDREPTSERAGSPTPQALVRATGDTFFLHHTGVGLTPSQTRGVDVAQLRALGICSLIVVPIEANAARAGVLSLVMSKSGRRYSTSDVVMARDVAHRFALALDDAHAREAALCALRRGRDALAIVAHDLRTPLQAMHLATRLLLAPLEGAPPSAADARKLALIERCSDRMARLLDDIQDLSSVDAGRFAVTLEACVLCDVFDEASETLCPLSALSAVHLDFRAEREGVRVLCDRGRVVQVLTNLVGNAVKFSGPGGEVGVSARIVGPDVRVEVTDRGKGIPPNDLPHLFEPYWRGQDTASKHPGLGLGLYISKALVEAHGGRIGAESNSAHGSTFFFTLPLFPVAL